MTEQSFASKIFHDDVENRCELIPREHIVRRTLFVRLSVDNAVRTFIIVNVPYCFKISR